MVRAALRIGWRRWRKGEAYEVLGERMRAVEVMERRLLVD
jgi:hypothetical protein